jgi:hypothetical protein
VVVLRRRLRTGLLAASLALGPAVALTNVVAAPAHAQSSDAEGGDGGDASGGSGAAGASGVLPTGNQNDAAPDERACFADDGCPTVVVDDDLHAMNSAEFDAFADGS